MKTEETKQIRKVLWLLWHKTFDIHADISRMRNDIDKTFQLLTILEAEEE